MLGDHIAACPRSGVLRARAGPLERCREAGATVATNVLSLSAKISVASRSSPTDSRSGGVFLWLLTPPLSPNAPCRARGCTVALGSPGQGADVPGALPFSPLPLDRARSRQGSSASSPAAGRGQRLRMHVYGCILTCILDKCSPKGPSRGCAVRPVSPAMSGSLT